MTWFTEVIAWFQALEGWVVGAAGSGWSYLVTFVLCWADGFFPPVPSESVVIALASLSDFHDGPVRLWLLVPIAVVGAMLGDATAYWIGRALRPEWIFRGERGARILQRATDLLEHKGPQVLLTARFIPVYRVAINMVAGTLRFPFRRFLIIDLVSASMWAIFSCVIGLVAGAFFEKSPLLGIVVGVVLGLVVGWLLGKAHEWWEARKAKTSASEGSAAP